MSHVWMSHITHVHGPCHTYEYHLYVCDITHAYLWHDSFLCVTWLIHMCDMSHMCDTTNSYVWHDSFTCMTRLICMCDMTPSYLCHDSFTFTCSVSYKTIKRFVSFCQKICLICPRESAWYLYTMCLICLQKRKKKKRKKNLSHMSTWICLSHMFTWRLRHLSHVYMICPIQKNHKTKTDTLKSATDIKTNANNKNGVNGGKSRSPSKHRIANAHPKNSFASESWLKIKTVSRLCVAVCCSVCCSVLQCVAVCCSVLQCVAVYIAVYMSIFACVCILQM